MDLFKNSFYQAQTMNTEKYKILIVKQLLGEATDAEAQELEKWRKASAENEKLYADYTKIWRSSPKSEPAQIPDIDHEWRQLADALEFKLKKSTQAVALPTRTTFQKFPAFQHARIWAIAAMFMVVILGALFLNRLRSPDSTIEVFAQAGTQEQVELPDGSIVRLNSVSSISYESEFSATERIVHLTGEAFFDIVKEGRPFIVKTENAQIQVLGTMFNVWARQNETRVVVEEGQVALTTAQTEAQLEILINANQMGICIENELTAQSIEVDAVQRFGWLHGKIVFNKAPLSEVVAELQRLYDVSIYLEDDHLANQTLTASFSKKSLESVLESVCLAMQLNFRREGEGYTISGQ